MGVFGPRLTMQNEPVDGASSGGRTPSTRTKRELKYSMRLGCTLRIFDAVANWRQLFACDAEGVLHNHHK